MGKSSTKMANSSSVKPIRLLSDRLDRFDAIMLGAMLVLALAIGAVILRGNQLSGAALPASGAPRVVYLGPMDSIVQNLWLIDPGKGSQPVRLTNAKDGILDFDVSRGGQIVYTEQMSKGASNLMLYDPQQGASRLLYECQDASCMEAVWRPDGKMIAFDRSELNTGTNMPPGAPRAWLFDVQTNQARPLFSDNQRLGFTPHWSPDGTKLAVFDVGAGGIAVYDFNTRKDTLIPAFQGSLGSFSPDSTKLWFPKVVEVQQQQYSTHIVIVDLSTTPFTQHDLIPDSAQDDDTGPIWMPDGKSLIVERRPAGAPVEQDKQIYQVDVATGAAKPLVVDASYAHSNLTLSPSGDVLLFQRFKLGGQGARPELWTYEFKTQKLQKVADNANFPHWLP